MYQSNEEFADISIGEHPTSNILVTESFLSMNSPKTPAVPYMSSTVPGPYRPHSDKESRFESTMEMLDYVTRNWRQDFVTTDLVHQKAIEDFAVRPFFLLVDVDAPLFYRFQRARKWVQLPYRLGNLN